MDHPGARHICLDRNRDPGQQDPTRVSGSGSPGAPGGPRYQNDRDVLCCLLWKSQHQRENIYGICLDAESYSTRYLLVGISINFLFQLSISAALGPVFLDNCIKYGRDEWKEMGEEILTLAVLSILITAPLGAVCILALGPLLLDNKPPDTDRSRETVDSV